MHTTPTHSPQDVESAKKVAVLLKNAYDSYLDEMSKKKEEKSQCSLKMHTTPTQNPDFHMALQTVAVLLKNAYVSYGFYYASPERFSTVAVLLKNAYDSYLMHFAKPPMRKSRSAP